MEQVTLLGVCLSCCCGAGLTSFVGVGVVCAGPVGTTRISSKSGIGEQGLQEQRLRLRKVNRLLSVRCCSEFFQFCVHIR